MKNKKASFFSYSGFFIIGLSSVHQSSDLRSELPHSTVSKNDDFSLIFRSAYLSQFLESEPQTAFSARSRRVLLKLYIFFDITFFFLELSIIQISDFGEFQRKNYRFCKIDRISEKSMGFPPIL